MACKPQKMATDCNPLLAKFRDVMDTVQPHTPDVLETDVSVALLNAGACEPLGAPRSALPGASLPTPSPPLLAAPFAPAAPPAVGSAGAKLPWAWICGAVVVIAVLVVVVVVLVMQRPPHKATSSQRTRRKFRPPQDLPDEDAYLEDDVYDEGDDSDPPKLGARPPSHAQRVPARDAAPPTRFVEQDERSIGVEDEEDPMFQPLKRAGVN